MGNINNMEFPAWNKVEISRNHSRLHAIDFIKGICDEFIELHGDRYYGDDSSIVAGIALINDIPVTVIGQEKGNSIENNKKRNYGMANPEGYRKSLRLMKQAEKFNRPIVIFVDTPGAYCGIAAEERGQGEAIARNLFEIIDLEVPIISILIGEGGSGGALALTIADKIYMLENATFSIISPEAFSSILWKDSSRAKEAAEVMKITSKDLYDLGIIDEIILESNSGKLKSEDEIISAMKMKILFALNELMSKDIKKILTKRYCKYRQIGTEI